jgi:hypothetical protein
MTIESRFEEEICNNCKVKPFCHFYKYATIDNCFEFIKYLKSKLQKSEKRIEELELENSYQDTRLRYDDVMKKLAD